MQNSIAILSSDAPLEEKVLAVKTLEKFKNDIITFVDEPLNASINDINSSNVIETIEKIRNKLSSYKVNTIDDVKELYLLKSQLLKCMQVINDTKPTTKLIDGNTSINVTNKIKKKFSLATTVKNQFFDWNEINTCYQNETFSALINKIIVPDTELHSNIFNNLFTHFTFSIVKTKNGTIISYDKDGIEHCRILINEEGFEYMFYQYEDTFLCVYYVYEPLPTLYIKSNYGQNHTVDEYGFMPIERNNNTINEIIRYVFDKLNVI